ncbi:MAG: PD-(D/E)XK nuclease family protein [Gemmatimonadaceae bacterium]
MRKRLVGPDINFGREHLTALARETGGWIGWEATTLRTIAEELAFLPLFERGIRAGNDIEIGALVNRSLDIVIGDPGATSAFSALGSSLGFRQSLRDSILELRTAAVSTETIRDAVKRDSPAFDVPAVLAHYEHLLAAEELADPAELFRIALSSFDREAPFVLDGLIYFAPALMVRGLPGQLMQRLGAHGARVLAADPVLGSDAPSQLLTVVANQWGVGHASPSATALPRLSPLSWLSTSTVGGEDASHVDEEAVRIDVFAAATPSEELREICRRIVAEGLRWDEVEIVATDVDSYGIALDALCQQLGIGASMLHGVPLTRTRLGRALERWFHWLDDGMPADVLRQALEAGELHVANSDVSSPALAREFRSLKIGWGRARYEQAIERIESTGYLSRLRREEDETAEEHAERLDARRRGSAALSSLLRALLAAAPEVPERGSDRSVRASISGLAKSTLLWLAMLPIEGIAEQQTVLRFQARLAQIAALEEANTSFVSALAALRDALSDLRAWPLVTGERKPWSVAGGMLHLSDLAHAGSTGRKRLFIAGMDAERTMGGGRQDPLLPDAIRRAIPGGALITSLQRRDDAAFALAATLASVRGHVTLSHATSTSLASRESGPAPTLLQAWRIAKKSSTLSYEDLRAALRPPASAVPARAVGGTTPALGLLDARDVWLDALSDGALLLDADALVHESFPMLGGGLNALALSRGADLTAYHGLVPQAGTVLDPTGANARPISASELERLSRCPLSWLYRYGLSLYLPDDPEFDATQWLDERQRGLILHEIFEEFIRGFGARQSELAGPAAEAMLFAITEENIARWRDDVPPPGLAVFEAEAAELRHAANAFLTMERDLAASDQAGIWRYVELQFGGKEPAGEYELGDGRTLRVAGWIDRVDALGDGTLRVIDYKTGSAGRFTKSTKKGIFNGGRHLQPALYAGALQNRMGTLVTRFEYRFPTQRGDNAIIAYSADDLVPARALIASLLEYISGGTFVPTVDTDDCSYCDHQTICRVSHGLFDVTSPRATWAAENETLPALVSMRARRSPPEDK